MLADQPLRNEFSSFFSYPLAPTSIPDMLARHDWRRFEQFVDYTFERAGNYVKDVSLERRGNNIDLEIYHPSSLSTPTAIVQVKLHQTDVSPELVYAFGGVTDHAAGAIGYLFACVPGEASCL